MHARRELTLPIRALDRARRWLSVLPAVLLLGALLAGGFHHHDAREDGHACAVCALGGAPATVTVAVALAPPLAHAEVLAPPRAATPLPARVRRASSRAPPIG